MSRRNEFLAQYGHSEHLDHLINSPEDVRDDYYTQPAMLRNPTLTHKHLSHLLDSEYSSVRRAAVGHPNITDDHVQKIMKWDHYGAHIEKNALMTNPNIKPHAIKQAYDEGDEGTKKLIGSNSFLPASLRPHILNTTNDPIVKKIITSRQKSDDDLEEMIQSIANQLK